MNTYENQIKENISKILTSFNERISQLRATGAHPSILSGIKINYYDILTPLSQVANIKAPDATLLLVTPYEQSITAEILKAISISDLGLSAAEDSGVIRIPVPPLTQEKRLSFVKQLKEIAENSRISIRQARQEVNKKINSDEELSETEQKLTLDKIQKIIDEANQNIQTSSKTKEEELLKI